MPPAENIPAGRLPVNAGYAAWHSRPSQSIPAHHTLPLIDPHPSQTHALQGPLTQFPDPLKVCILLAQIVAVSCMFAGELTRTDFRVLRSRLFAGPKLCWLPIHKKAFSGRVRSDPRAPTSVVFKYWRRNRCPCRQPQ